MRESYEVRLAILRKNLSNENTTPFVDARKEKENQRKRELEEREDIRKSIEESKGKKKEDDGRSKRKKKENNSRIQK